MLFRFLFKTNLFIAFAAVAFLWSNILLLHLESKHLILLSLQVFFSTWFIYQYSRWIYYKKGDYATDQDGIKHWIDKNPNIHRLTTFGSLFFSILLLLFLTKKTILVLLVMGGLSFFYPLAVLRPLGCTIRLRDIPFVKIVIIALVWSITTVLLPVIESGIFISTRKDIWLLLILQFLFMLFICLPFDMNDILSDKEKGLKTFPVYFGSKIVKMVLLILGNLYLLGLFFWFSFFYHSGVNFLPKFVLLSLLLFFLQWFALIKSEQAKKWQISLVYDGSMIFYLFCVLFN